MANSILQVENLVKRYGDVEAVRGVSFAVEEARFSGCSDPTAPARRPPLRFSKAFVLRMGTRLCLRS